MDDIIRLGHGSGGKLSHDLIAKVFAAKFNNSILNRMDDSAVFDLAGKIAFTTDSFVVNPLFFPGGDIGKLAVCGTINDLSMAGAVPHYLSAAVIIEEGFPIDDLEKITISMQQTAKDAGVAIVTGDTKVVNKGSADKLFITTAGVGVIPEGIAISGSNARPGDRVILSGTIGDHGIAVLSRREGLKFSVPVESDCAPLNNLVADIVKAASNIRCLRDPTRGGLATTLNEIAAQSNVGIRIEETSIPVHDGIRAACELLGLDPLYIANEGKLIAIVPPDTADCVLDAIKQHKYGHRAAIIGTVTDQHAGKVTIKTALGASRILDMLAGEMLPRIC